MLSENSGGCKRQQSINRYTDLNLTTHSKYNKFGRTYLFDLDFHHLHQDDGHWSVKYTVDAYHAGNVRVSASYSPLHAPDPASVYQIFGAVLLPRCCPSRWLTPYQNHSCDPNCRLVPCYINESNIDKPLLAVFAQRDIDPFEEICFSYYGDPDDEVMFIAPSSVMPVMDWN